MKRFSWNAVVLLVMLTGTPIVLASEQLGLVPYVGVDAQMRHMDFKKNFGDNLVKRHYAQPNVYVGVNLNDFFGIEAGYEHAAKKSKTTTIKTGDSFLGSVSPLVPFSTTSTSSMHGFYANLVGLLPISDEYRLKLIGSLGFAKLKARISIYSPPDDADFGYKFVKSKWVPRANIGFQHMINDQFGVRALVGWEKTSVFKNLHSVNTTSIFRASLKDSMTAGFGLFYHFN